MYHTEESMEKDSEATPTRIKIPRQRHPPLQTPKPALPETLVISPTGPPTRVPPPRVEPPRVVSPPRVVPPPRAEDLVTPQRSHRLADLHNDIKYEVENPARNTRIQTGKRRPTTQDYMLVAVAHLKVTPAQLAQRKFPVEMISAVLDKDTGKLM